MEELYLPQGLIEEEKQLILKKYLKIRYESFVNKLVTIETTTTSTSNKKKLIVPKSNKISINSSLKSHTNVNSTLIYRNFHELFFPDDKRYSRTNLEQSNIKSIPKVITPTQSNTNILVRTDNAENNSEDEELSPMIEELLLNVDETIKIQQQYATYDDFILRRNSVTTKFLPPNMKRVTGIIFDPYNAVTAANYDSNNIGKSIIL